MTCTTRPPKRLRLIEAVDKPSQPPTLQSTSSHGDNSYLPSLKPSPLRPRCAANERIQKWKPVTSRTTHDQQGKPTNLSENDLLRICEVLKDTYAPNTRSTYGTGLLVFHIFCDSRNIKEMHRAPIDPIVLASFISTLVGTYGGGTIRNYVYGVRAWHIIHGAQWKVNEDEFEALLTAGKKMAPKDSRRKEKEPWTVEYLAAICNHLNPDDRGFSPLHLNVTFHH